MIPAQTIHNANAQPSTSQAQDFQSTAPAQEAPAKPYTLHDRTALWTDSDDNTQTRLKLGVKIDVAFDTQTLTSAQLIAALAEHHLHAPDITALQRPRPGLFTISFADPETKHRFINIQNFSVDGHRPLIRDNRTRQTTYVSIRNAPPELPDAAIIARLKSFGEITAFRRCLHPNTRIENGHRTARMIIKTPIPSFLRIASESIHIVYAGQTKTCRKCNRPDHDARNCQNYACFNCGEVGHFATFCSEPTRCSICQSIAHKAYTCPYAIIDRINPDVPISTALADALSHVPVIPTAENTADETDHLTDAETLERLRQDTMDCTYATDTPNNDTPNNTPNEPTADNRPPTPSCQQPLRLSPPSSQETVKSSKASAAPSNQTPFKKPPPPAPKPAKKHPPALPRNTEPNDADDDDCKSTTSTKRKDRPPSSSDSENFFNPTRRKTTRPSPIPCGKKKDKF